MKQFNSTQQQEEGIDIKHVLLKIMGSWPILVISMIIGLSIALVVNRYSRNIYKLSTILSVEEAENPLGSSGVSLAFNWGGMDALESKLALIESYTIQERVAESLGWEISYFSTGRLVESEAYKTSPIQIEFDPNHFQPVGVRFKVFFKGQNIEILPEDGEWSGSLYKFEDKSDGVA